MPEGRAQVNGLKVESQDEAAETDLTEDIKGTETIRTSGVPKPTAG